MFHVRSYDRLGGNKSSSESDCGPVLTYAKDVKTKSLCDRFADQLMRKAVESNMAAQTQVTLLFILKDTSIKSLMKKNK